MPSMASLILRAAARVSSSAASAAYRFAAAAAAAAAARSGSGGAAASDPLKHSSSVAAAGTARSPASSGSVHPPVAAGAPRSSLSHDTIATLQAVMDGAPFVQPDWAKFEANEKDLESDDALWDLYERWCKFFNQERDREEMARRFSYFKETVLSVEENKKSDLPYSLGINKFADGKLSELYGKTKTRKYVRRPRSASPIYGSEVGFSFNRDPAANKGPGRRN